MYRNALVSVSNKSGLIELIKPLHEQGMRVVSTGGTARFLQENGIDVVLVSQQTQFPEVMDGRVKTLHPKIHMALLADTDNQQHQEVLKQFELESFDLVVGNLYPFEKAVSQQLSEQDSVELIDIGGPSFLRAAAKSFKSITVLCDPMDYPSLSKGSNFQQRKALAAKVFHHVSGYDQMIARTLAGDSQVTSGYTLNKKLRYGENPQQTASWLSSNHELFGWHQAHIIQGKELSYNNLLDCDGALKTLALFQDQACCISVKHNNPCGVGVGHTIEEAVTRSLAADPVSVFGGIVAMNQLVDAPSATRLTSLFLECVIAPAFTGEALEILSKKSNLRVIRMDQLPYQSSNLSIKSIFGGLLVQDVDQIPLTWDNNWKVFGAEPDDQMKETLLLSWKTCAQLKSNAIAICHSKQSLGLGMGQVNRVDAVEQALGRAKRFHSDVDRKTVALASDAFFPFADSIELIAKAGIQWVIQPGGSIKDEEVIAKAKELNVNMIFTGKRHFLH